MGFHNLNVCVREEGGGLLGQTAQHRYPQAHVAAEKDGNFPGGIGNHGLFLLGVAGGADYCRCADSLGVGQHIGDGTVVGEINDHVRFHGPQFRKGPGDAVFSVQADLAHHFVTQNAADQLSHGAVGAANDCFHTFTPSFLISSNSF